jgi:hypothetical protein
MKMIERRQEGKEEMGKNEKERKENKMEKKLIHKTD